MLRHLGELVLVQFKLCIQQMTAFLRTGLQQLFIQESDINTLWFLHDTGFISVQKTLNLH